MCRYAAPYKPHYACFNCRKTFKRRLLSDFSDSTSNSVEARCPQCRNLTADMGLDFKSPKKDDKKSWEHLEKLFKAGMTFHSCGCTGPGLVPATDEELIQYLEKQKGVFQKHLSFWNQRKQPVTKSEINSEKDKNWLEHRTIPKTLKGKNDLVDNVQAIDYWVTRIRDIEDKIKEIRN